MQTVKIDFIKYRQHENKIFRKSLSYLNKNDKGKAHLDLFQFATSTNFSWIKQNTSPDEDEMTVQFIGARLFNDAMIAYHDALSGYYQASFSMQRSLIEIQFLLDYFRTSKEMIKVWKESTNAERYKKFGPHELYKLLDKRDEETGLINSKRKADYQRFCELATHVSFPGIKLLANNKNEIEAGPFYDKKKLSSALFELNKRYIMAVISLCPLLKAKELEAMKLLIDMVEKFDGVFGYEVGKGEHMQNSIKMFKKAIEGDQALDK